MCTPRFQSVSDKRRSEAIRRLLTTIFHSYRTMIGTLQDVSKFDEVFPNRTSFDPNHSCILNSSCRRPQSNNRHQ